VVLPHCRLPAGLETAERIRATVERELTLPDYPDLRVTLSAGVGAFPDTAGTQEELIRRTDAALYRAKDEGRNRVCAAEGP